MKKKLLTETQIRRMAAIAGIPALGTISNIVSEKLDIQAEGEHKEALAEEIKEAIANQRSKPPPSIVDQILTMLGIKTGTPFTYSTAKTLLDNCILGSKKIYWFDDNKGRIGKDFRSRHTLLLIYIWMVHKRLLKMDNGQDVQVGSAHTYIHT